MTKKQLKNKIDELTHQLFLLDMKDNWDSADYSYSNSLNQELSMYQKMLDEKKYEKEI